MLLLFVVVVVVVVDLLVVTSRIPSDLSSPSSLLDSNCHKYHFDLLMRPFLFSNQLIVFSDLSMTCGCAVLVSVFFSSLLLSSLLFFFYLGVVDSIFCFLSSMHWTFLSDDCNLLHDSY